jgi:hypothetical protein
MKKPKRGWYVVGYKSYGQIILGRFSILGAEEKVTYPMNKKKVKEIVRIAPYYKIYRLVEEKSK